MLEINNSAVCESIPDEMWNAHTPTTATVIGQLTTDVTPYYQWGNWPVYVYTDKTKKAIDILKVLEDDGLKVTSVKKFIELTEKIAAIL